MICCCGRWSVFRPPCLIFFVGSETRRFENLCLTKVESDSFYLFDGYDTYVEVSSSLMDEIGRILELWSAPSAKEIG